MAVRIIEGTEKRAALESSGGCETCGFCEPGLIAWQTGGTRTAVSCEECLENLHPSENPRFVVAHVPELDIAAVSHYVRVTAFFAYATKTYSHGVIAHATCSPRRPQPSDRAMRPMSRASPLPESRPGTSCACAIAFGAFTTPLALLRLEGWTTSSMTASLPSWTSCPPTAP